ncbi:hypothetical protein A2U01_0006755 [Trifolium medium]|uniref:Uncharacterized protein n=1 Tax=Trifolium medium TaxID=97028 RepID=A0A392MFF2_9FABA|nr:hypothetical protein [Trifolium medium]
MKQQSAAERAKATLDEVEKEEVKKKKKKLLKKNTSEAPKELDKEVQDLLKEGVAKRIVKESNLPKSPFSPTDSIIDENLRKIIKESQTAIWNLESHLSPDTLNSTPLKHFSTQPRPSEPIQEAHSDSDSFEQEFKKIAEAKQKVQEFQRHEALRWSKPTLEHSIEPVSETQVQELPPSNSPMQTSLNPTHIDLDFPILLSSSYVDIFIQPHISNLSPPKYPNPHPNLFIRDPFNPTLPSNPSRPPHHVSNPYKLFPSPEPDHETLGLQIATDLRNLYSMKDHALIFPSDIDSEVEAIINRVKSALFVYAQDVKEAIKGRGMDVVKKVVDFAEQSNPLRITEAFRFDADEMFVLNALEKTLQEDLGALETEILEEEMKLAEENSKGKSLVVDTTPIPSPERPEPHNEEIIGTSSGGEVLRLHADLEEAKRKQELQDVKLDSLAEDQHALRETVSEISGRQEALVQNQKAMDSKLDAILALLSKKP